MYINERILHRSFGNTSTKKKLQYTHGLEIREEGMVSLEKLMLREEAGMDEEVTDVRVMREIKGETTREIKEKMMT